MDPRLVPLQVRGLVLALLSTAVTILEDTGPLAWIGVTALTLGVLMLLGTSPWLVRTQRRGSR